MTFRTESINFMWINLIVLLPLYLLINTETIHAKSSNETFNVEIIFKQVSHQNPWLIKEPISGKSKAIKIGKNEYFTITLPNEKPLYGEIKKDNKPNSKLKIKKYDESTGFTILENKESSNTSIVSLNQKKTARACSYGNYQYIHFSFSLVPIRAVTINRASSSEEDYFLFSKNELCGFVMGSYLIPTEYIIHFKNSKDSNPIPHPGFEFESVLNSSERSFYFEGTRKGIIVKKVYPGVGPNFQLMPGDAIYEINGIPLKQFSDSQLGDKALDTILRSKSGLKNKNSITNLKILRNGVTKDISYKLNNFHDDEFLVPESHPYGKPPYIIAGGLLFTELTASYLKEFGEDYRSKSEKKLLYISESFQSKSHPYRDRVIILSRLLLHPNNQGYQEFQDLILNRVNGNTIRNLRELKEIISRARDEYIIFEFSAGRTIVFQKDEISQINYDILKTYSLNSLDNIGE